MIKSKEERIERAKSFSTINKSSFRIEFHELCRLFILRDMSTSRHRTRSPFSFFFFFFFRTFHILLTRDSLFLESEETTSFSFGLRGRGQSVRPGCARA